VIFLASSSTRLTELQKMIDWLISSCGHHGRCQPLARSINPRRYSPWKRAC
jgi:hypothetical protein